MIATALSMLACSESTEFSLTGEENLFKQSVTSRKAKVDILWVVDNSGSMATSQNQVAANFQSFINKFQDTNFDFQIAVVTTDAWLAPFDSNPDLARFRDGTPDTGFSGVKVLTPSTPNLEQAFITNIVQGTNGDADERGWQSMKEALSMQANRNTPFPREDSLLAVIFLTDEDDFSHDGSANLQGSPQGVNNPALHDTQDYYDFLFDLTKSSANNLNFVVNTIGIFDNQCLTDLAQDQWLGRKIAQRYVGITDATGGYRGSLCDDFSNVMAGISDTILEKTTTFTLTRMPAIDTIEVTVNGQVLPQDPDNGWSFNSETLVISFNGNGVPPADATVSITYDPASMK